MARGPDASALLERALGVSAGAAGIAMEVSEAVAVRWASATFTGARHVLDLRLMDDAAGHTWLDRLSEADMPMRGHLLADCIVVRRHRDGQAITARIEALTVEGP